MSKKNVHTPEKPCKGCPCIKCGAAYHVVVCPKDEEGQTMILGTKDDKREDEDDDKDNNEGEIDVNDDVEDGRLYYGQYHQEKQDYEDMNFHDPDDQSYESVDLPDDNNENQIELAGTTLFTS